MAAKAKLTIGQKLSKIQAEYKSEKSRFNSFGKYKYRSAEDILEALKPLNEKYDVYFTNSEEFIDGGMIISTATIHDAETGESVSSSAVVGVDFNQKGMQVPQQFGSASSYGKKYAFGNLLLIDDTADSDATNTHDKSTPQKKQLTLNSKEFKDAQKYVAEGGSVDAIKKKYQMSKGVEEKLQVQTL